MERERSLSSSSSDSWSLLEEIDDENDEQQQIEKSDSLSPLTSDHKNASKQQIIGQMEPLESISSVQLLPLDISATLLASSQHLLVVTTPASSSIVTQTGAILSPEHSAQALANNDPDSPVLVSPPKSPPIESTFTFLKDPKLRISFSDSCESKEEEDDNGRAKALEEGAEIVAKTGVEEKTMDDEVFEQSQNEPRENSANTEETETENLTKEITEKVDVEIEKAEEAFEQEKVVQLMNKEEESTKMEIEAKNEEDDEELSEPESSSILSGHESIDESIRSSRPEYSSNTSSFGIGSNSPQFNSSSEMEDTEEEEEKSMDMGNKAENGMEGNVEEEIESSTISSIPSSMLSSSISSNSLADEQILPSLPPTESIPSIKGSNNLERPEMLNDSNVEMGWTELSISSVSAYSTDEVSAEKGAGQEEAMHSAEMVARRFDELSEKMDESLWQRILDETFGSLKNFERSDRIINILIIAMFLTSISSMTILHILENTWIGTNISNSMQQSSPRIPLQSSIQPPTEFRANSRQTDDKWNSELRQCKDELIEAKHAYESKAKLLHYVRFKEMEQEAMVEELKKELEMAKLSLENLQHQQKESNGQIFLLDDSTNGKHNEFEEAIEMEERESMNFGQKRRMKKRWTMRNAIELTKRPKFDEEMKRIISNNPPITSCPGFIEPTEYGDEQSGMPAPPPMIWPGIVEQIGGRLIAPPATLDSQLMPPPVTINKKKTEDKAIDVQEDLNQYWSSKFVYKLFDDQQASTSEHSEQIEEESKRSKIEKESEEEEMDEENGFGTKMLTNWQKYNEILANLSTQSGRTQMLKSVRNAVVARLNRTIEKTTTALAAATKLMTSENFGQNFFTSTVREMMARMENSGLSNIVDCLNNGIQRIQNIQLCIPPFLDWPILVEEEDEDEDEDEIEENENSKNDVTKVENKNEENKENDAKCKYVDTEEKKYTYYFYVFENGKARNLTCDEFLIPNRYRYDGIYMGREKVSIEENDAKKEENKNEEEDGAKNVDDKDEEEKDASHSLENENANNGTGGWLLQRATARAALRNGKISCVTYVKNHTGKGAARFNRWLFARAALRQKQRKEQRNGTMESETRSSLFRDDWMFARQKIRAKLRDKQNEENKENWLFVRQKMREKAREEGAGENDESEEELTIGKGNWLFGRQKLRQKLRNEEKHFWTSTESAEEEEEEEWPKKKQRKWWRKKEQKKKWKKGFAGKWTTTANFNQEEFYGDNKFSGDEDED